MTPPTKQVAAGSLTIHLGGQTLDLLPDRAVWSPSAATLLIADPHLGKEATFRAAGIPVPDVTHSNLARLSTLIQATRCRRLVVLGDLLHSRWGIRQSLVDQMVAWRERHSELDVLLVRGNHDIRSGDPPASWKMDCCDQTHLEQLLLRHVPSGRPEVAGLAGHLHPKHRLRWGAESLTLPCFVLQGQTLILPAFGSFVDGQVFRVSGERIFVIAEDSVLEVTS